MAAPIAYYTLAEPAGATRAGDTSGGQAPMLTMAGSGADVAFGTEMGLVGSPSFTAAGFSGGKYLTGSVSSPGFGAACMLYWFKTTASGTMRVLNGGMGANIPNIYLSASTGKLCTDPADGAAYRFGNPVNDGNPHLLVLDQFGATLDDVHYGLLSGYWVDSVAHIGGGATDSPSTASFVGTIAHVAFFSATPSAAKLTNIYQGGTTGFAGETGAQRIARLAGYANLPVGTLDPGLTLMPPA